MKSMGQVYKPTKRHKTWCVRFRDHQGILRILPGFRDKRLSEALMRKLDHMADIVAAGAEVPEDMVDWLCTKLDARRRQKLVNFGLIDKRLTHNVVPLFDVHTVDPERGRVENETLSHIDKWRNWMRNLGRTEQYIQITIKRVVDLFDECGFRIYTDINSEDVLDKVAQWSHRSKATQNHYIRAAKMFCNWMVKRRRAMSNLLADIVISEPKAHEIVHDRRPLSLKQIEHLLNWLLSDDATFHHFATGQERALVYWIIMETGLRAKEFYSLKISSFELDVASYISVQSAYTKNKEAAKCPISDALATALKFYFAQAMKMPDAQPFNLPVVSHLAEMLYVDLKHVGIEHHVGFKVIDFHALRTTFITNTVRAGLHVKEAQGLARHKTESTTLKYYVKLSELEFADAHRRMPSVAPSVAHGRVATSKSKQKRAT